MLSQRLGHVVQEGSHAAICAQLGQGEQPQVQAKERVERGDAHQVHVGVANKARQNLHAHATTNGVGPQQSVVVHA